MVSVDSVSGGSSEVRKAEVVACRGGSLIKEVHRRLGRRQPAGRREERAEAEEASVVSAFGACAALAVMLQPCEAQECRAGAGAVNWFVLNIDEFRPVGLPGIFLNQLQMETGVWATWNRQEGNGAWRCSLSTT